jgi:hypothetical protein
MHGVNTEIRRTKARAMYLIVILSSYKLQEREG